MNRAAKIRFVAKIQGTPVLPYVIDAYVSLRQAGNIEACDAPASGDEEAFYIENRVGKIVAVLSFFISPSGNYFTVNMGFVNKGYRKRGLYGDLWKRLVEEGKTRGVKTIIGYHKPGNDKILAFNASVGRKIKYVCTEYHLPGRRPA